MCKAVQNMRLTDTVIWCSVKVDYATWKNAHTTRFRHLALLERKAHEADRGILNSEAANCSFQRRAKLRGCEPERNGR